MSKTKKITALNKKIQKLEAENFELSRRAEDASLLGLIAGIIQDEKQLVGMLESVLERFSTIKDIPYCTCGRFDEGGLSPIATFSKFSDKAHAGYPITFDDSIEQELLSFNVVVNGAEGLSFGFDKNQFQPAAVAMIPFSSLPIPDGVFLFAEQNGSQQVLLSKLPALRQAIDLVLSRAENLFLQQMVQEAKANLEDRIAERTKVLSETNIELKQEIAKREQSESALRNANDRFTTVLDSIDAQVFVADLQTHELLFINRKMKHDFGADLVGEKCYRALRGESAPCAICPNEKLTDPSGKPAGVVVWEDLNPITGIYCMNYDKAIEWVDGRMARIQIAMDISYVKKIEEEKERYYQQLLQAQKLEAIGTLAGGIAHDFNNLLMGVRGHASLMLAEKSVSDRDKKHLLSIDAIAQRAADLASRLLGIAKKGKYDVESTDTNALISSSMDLFGRTKKEITIHLCLADDTWPMEVDKTQIQQVILNICVNAWQAMPGGGDLTVKTENTELDDNAAKARHLAPGRYVKISFSDTGTGIAPEIKGKIFDPFFTTKAKMRGTGLGLASAYGIITNHGGIIEVASQQGQGATIVIYLPATTRLLPQETEVPGSKIDGSGTILLVDDEEIIRQVGSAILQKIGFQVIVAENGRQAIELFTQHHHRIDAVLLDMVMPGMGGGQVYDRLKQISSRVRVLLSSGYSEGDEARDILARGCNGFIQKPFGMVALSQKLDEILNSQPDLKN